MLIQFRERPLDLYVSIGYTAALGVILLAQGIGNLTAILMVVFFPGYLVLAALFPANRELEWPARIALSFGLTFALVPLLGLVLNFTPFGLSMRPVVAATILFTLLTGLIAYRRRMQLPATDRLSVSLKLTWPKRRESGTLDRALSITLASVVIGAAVTLVYVTIAPGPPQPFTEFYVLGGAANSSGYVTRLNVSEPGRVVLGIANHEAASVNYAVRVDLVGLRIVYNATSGFNETVEVNRTTWSTFNVALADGRNWMQSYTFQINDTGLWKVQFLLFKDRDFSIAYREVHLFVRVSL